MSLGSSAAGIENLTLLAGSAALAATGNAQDNLLRGNGHDNTLVGLAGNDTLIGGNGNDTMLGGAGNDDYRVDRAGDVVTESAGAGSDTVHSRVNCALSANVEDLVLTGNALAGTGNALNNVLTGDARDNLLEGGAGNDTLEGGAGVDLLAGGAGNDTYLVDRTADDIVELAGGGIDTVHSSAGYFQLDAWVENLVLDAGAGNAQGVGNNGNNVLTGNDGNDTLDGREGNDTLTGGAGADTFVFDTAPAANLDTIADYSVTEDTLRLDSAIFASLGAEGALSPGMLHAGAGASTAADANDFLIYDTSTGALYYDADGSGGASAPVEFALLAGAPALTSADFVVG
jgi:serralysin